MPPLSLVLQIARSDMLKAVNNIRQKHGLPACLMDGIISGIQSDIRAQASAELIRDIEQQSKAEEVENNE